MLSSKMNCFDNLTSSPNSSYNKCMGERRENLYFDIIIRHQRVDFPSKIVLKKRLICTLSF